MSAYSLTLDEACAFLGISRPTASNWIRSGRLTATRKDPRKPKSPYLVTRQACIAALNNPLHTVAVSASDEHEDKPCQSFAEVKSGTPASHRRAVKELSSLLARPTSSKRRSSTTS
ncbi:helix-turn-helix domain-containing protein [Erwinia sp. V90_4]|uniref:helix-turn-helix domain-containing protein n=1 Tax=Erwinia sp. V90_4 TaxID=3044239 RepID=UPI001AA7E871|nr:helix-turn-helix domain-containing protein [Erwinia sp. V90_4]MBN1085579.1 helix-turn-helix domain-containing protein [Erwinia aphidicola]MDI3438980.1 helix-turn-helix domain-containing protein [Erwinia sp. V90_4]